MKISVGMIKELKFLKFTNSTARLNIITICNPTDSSLNSKNHWYKLKIFNWAFLIDLYQFYI